MKSSQPEYVYKIVGYDAIGDGDCDIDVGVVFDEDLAKRVVEDFQKQNDEVDRLWEKYGKRCTVGCEAFQSKTDKKAIAALEECEKFDCPCKKNIHLGEVFYGGGDHGEDVSGGFEVMCDGKAEFCTCPWKYNYGYVKLKVLHEQDYKDSASLN